MITVLDRSHKANKQGKLIKTRLRLIQFLENEMKMFDKTIRNS